MQRNLVKVPFVGALAGISLVTSVLGVAAHDEVVAAGNGGTAEASANGGAVLLGSVNSGDNSGSRIGVGDSWGQVIIGGGSMANTTGIAVSAEGGVGISDASGGDDNIAFEDDFYVLP